MYKHFPYHHWIFLIVTSLILCYRWGYSSDTLTAEPTALQNKIALQIQNYYTLYNQLDLVQADNMVDHRLKHVSENGAVQQFLIRDEVLYGARRFEHQLKHLADYTIIQTPEQFHIQSAGDAIIASFLLHREKRLKADHSAIEQQCFRVTWVLAQKEGNWLVFHEHQSEFNPPKQ